MTGTIQKYTGGSNNFWINLMILYFGSLFVLSGFTLYYDSYRGRNESVKHSFKHIRHIYSDELTISNTHLQKINSNTHKMIEQLNSILESDTESPTDMFHIYKNLQGTRAFSLGEQLRNKNQGKTYDQDIVGYQKEERKKKSILLSQSVKTENDYAFNTLLTMLPKDESVKMIAGINDNLRILKKYVVDHWISNIKHINIDDLHELKTNKEYKNTQFNELINEFKSIQSSTEDIMAATEAISSIMLDFFLNVNSIMSQNEIISGAIKAPIIQEIQTLQNEFFASPTKIPSTSKSNTERGVVSYSTYNNNNKSIDLNSSMKSLVTYIEDANENSINSNSEESLIKQSLYDLIENSNTILQEHNLQNIIKKHKILLKRFSRNIMSLMTLISEEHEKLHSTINVATSSLFQLTVNMHFLEEMTETLHSNIPAIILFSMFVIPMTYLISRRKGKTRKMSKKPKKSTIKKNNQKKKKRTPKKKKITPKKKPKKSTIKKNNQKKK